MTPEEKQAAVLSEAEAARLERIRIANENDLTTKFVESLPGFQPIEIVGAAARVLVGQAVMNSWDTITIPLAVNSHDVIVSITIKPVGKEGDDDGRIPE